METENNSNQNSEQDLFGNSNEQKEEVKTINPSYEKEEILSLPKSIRKDLALKEIKTIIEEFGVWNVNKLALGRKYGFDDKTIAYWLKHILRGIPAEQIDKIAIDFEGAYKNILKFNRIVLSDPNRELSERQKASLIILEAMEKYTKFLESYGRKPITSNVVIQTNVTNVQQNLLTKIQNRITELNTEDAKVKIQSQKSRIEGNGKC
jgi:hypothetical protein